MRRLQSTLDPCRILAVLHIAEAGGPPRTFRPWLEAAARTASVEIVVPEVGSAERLYASLGTTHVLPYRAAMLPRSVADSARLLAQAVRDTRMFTGLIRSRRPDVVLVATTVLPAVLVAAHRAGIPAVVYAAEIHDSAFARRPLKTAAAFAVRRLTEALAASIVCCSDTVARQYDSNRASGVITISPGVMPAELVADRQRARQAFGVVGADPCVAVVGDITPGRAQADVVRALPVLRRTFPSVRCLIVGATLDRRVDREYTYRVKRLLGELGVGDIVKLTGFVDPVADVYAAADVIVNPAHVSEGFGRVALEALAAGRPVVATRVGAVPEILRDGQDALLISPGRPDAIAEAVTTLWTDAELRQRLVEAGRARVLAEFAEHDATSRFLSVLGTVVDRDRR
jgi:glycosyltransferase involved in cell wall biosynthesis